MSTTPAVTTVIVLFNLKDAQQRADYERWAREVDLPTASALPSVDKFEVLKASGLLTGGASPYEYVEILRINNMAQLGTDVGTPTMQQVSAQFQAFADKPLFIMTTAL
jgi:REDY-like protein HapK